MKSFPWDSIAVEIGEDGYPVYDRQYMASDLQEVNRMFFTDGIFTGEANAFKVSPGDNLTVKVTPGKAIIHGTPAWEPDERELALEAAPVIGDRIDTVVLRWDANVDARSVDLYVVKGAASTTPVRPTLTRSETVWELGLCDIYIPEDSTTVSAERITDTRLDANRCGVAAPFVRLQTNDFYSQLQAQTQIAVDLAQSALDDTVAGQLANDISAKVSKSGDTMTGPLVIDDDCRIGFTDGSSVGAIEMYSTGQLTILVDKDGERLNSLKFRTDGKVELFNPLPITSGGTGANSQLNAANNLLVSSLARGVSIPANADLNNYKTPGNYVCETNATATTIVNAPTPAAFKMYVYDILGSASGDSGYIGQEAIIYKSGRRLYRLYDTYQNTWTDWSYTVIGSDTIAIAHGGTGATTAAGALASLGIVDHVIASGVHTDSDGSNSHSYVKYNNGVGIVAVRKSTRLYMTKSNSVYSTVKMPMGTLPFVFSETPIMVPGAYSNSVSGVWGGFGVAPANFVNGRDILPVIAYSSSDPSKEVDMTFYVIAMGRWK